MRTLITAMTVAVLMGTPGKLTAQATRERLAERVQDLSLTNEQETKIANIRAEYRPKIQAAGKDLAALVKDESEKIRAVLTPDQKTKVESLKDERRESRADGLAERLAHLGEIDLTDAEIAKIKAIQAEYRPKIEKAMESLQGTLTQEQRKARADALRAGKKRRETLEAMNLTGGQKEKVETVGAEVLALVREELEKVRDVLSDEQKAKVAELKDERPDRAHDRWAARVANFRELNLTDAQKSTIADIRQKCRPKVHADGTKLRAEVREELGTILAALKG